MAGDQVPVAGVWMRSDALPVWERVYIWLLMTSTVLTAAISTVASVASHAGSVGICWVFGSQVDSRRARATAITAALHGKSDPFCQSKALRERVGQRREMRRICDQFHVCGALLSHPSSSLIPDETKGTLNSFPCRLWRGAEFGAGGDGCIDNDTPKEGKDIQGRCELTVTRKPGSDSNVSKFVVQ
ncbi:hypothetical protein FB451DRAFT_1162483 [Mycena latifolia]|nr:hypothetical protein FB451DRAFT_1162483 [Mycena latifolia]